MNSWKMVLCNSIIEHDITVNVLSAGVITSVKEVMFFKNDIIVLRLFMQGSVDQKSPCMCRREMRMAV